MRDSQCCFCKHLVVTLAENNVKLKTCKAFPEEIPHEVLFTYFVHNKPYHGDDSVLFEQDPDNEIKFDIEGAAKGEKIRQAAWNEP